MGDPFMRRVFPVPAQCQPMITLFDACVCLSNFLWLINNGQVPFSRGKLGVPEVALDIAHRDALKLLVRRVGLSEVVQNVRLGFWTAERIFACRTFLQRIDAIRKILIGRPFSRCENQFAAVARCTIAAPFLPRLQPRLQD